MKSFLTSLLHIIWPFDHDDTVKINVRDVHMMDWHGYKKQLVDEYASLGYELVSQRIDIDAAFANGWLKFQLTPEGKLRNILNNG